MFTPSIPAFRNGDYIQLCIILPSATLWPSALDFAQLALHNSGFGQSSLLRTYGLHSAEKLALSASANSSALSLKLV